MPDSVNERLSFNDAVEIMGDFREPLKHNQPSTSLVLRRLPRYYAVEVALSTILYLRNLYQPAIFTRVKAYDVPVYQCRHPEVRSYIAAFVRSVLGEMRKGNAQRISMVISSISTGEPLERFLFDISYMDLGKFRTESDKSVGLIGSPSQTEMRLILQGFLTRLSVLEGQLVELDPEDVTFALLMTMREGTVPSLDPSQQGESHSGRDNLERSPWVPELRRKTGTGSNAEGDTDTNKVSGSDAARRRSPSG